MTGVRILTEPLGGSPLVSAALEGSVPEEWFRSPPRSADAWRARLEEIRRDSATARWTDSLGPALQASGAARMRLERVANGAGVVVTTGQQPGLFGGPLYGFSKAISALALADELEKLTGIPVAPVFWAATDDADVAEASSTVVAGPGGVQVLRVTTSAAPGTPLSDVELGDVSEALAALMSAAGSGSHPDFLAAVRDAYAGSGTMGGAYVGLMRRLLEPRGIAVLDASHAVVRDAADPLLRAALRAATEVDVALRQRTADVQSAGFTPQVPLVPGLSTVFAVENGVKRRLPIKEAKRAAESAPRGALSPNVLLRPIVERAILPTAAYVAGPGELAYFVQLSAVAEVLGVRKPMAVPRWSGTIVEPHVERILSRYLLEIGDLRDPHAAETRFAREALPGEVTRTIAALRQDIGTRLASLQESTDAQTLLSKAIIEGAERTLQHRMDRLERRFLAAQKRTSATALQDIATARGSLFPGGKRQERALNPIPILARHGESVVDGMLRAAREHAKALLSGRASEHESTGEPGIGRASVR